MTWPVIKIAYFLFMLILVPTYWRYYGASNFLWLSDIGLFLTALAFWKNSKLLMSIAAVETLALEIVWNLDFFGILFFKVSKIKLADYMFDRAYPLSLRLLSLFHLVMPIIWLSYLQTFGYDPSAIKYAIVFFWLILFLCYFFTDEIQNINWVFLPKNRQLPLSEFSWLALLCIGFPLMVIFPTHYVFLKLFKVIYLS